MQADLRDSINILLGEIPNIVKPFFFVTIYLMAILIVGDNLNLNDSFWIITKEKIFNLAFYLGVFTLVFTALNKAPQGIRKISLLRRYPRDKVNEDYFLGQYDNRNEVYVFELKDPRRKLWIANLPTKRALWGDIVAQRLEMEKKIIDIMGKKINLDHYPQAQNYDGKLDLINPENKDNLVLVGLSLILIILVLVFLNLSSVKNFLMKF